MAVYLVAQINIHDRERYTQYEAGFMDIFQQYEGKLLSVDESPIVMEGENSFTRTVLIEFPNQKAADDWYQSDAYQSLMQHRVEASAGNIVSIKGLEGA